MSAHADTRRCGWVSPPGTDAPSFSSAIIRVASAQRAPGCCPTGPRRSEIADMLITRGSCRQVTHLRPSLSSSALPPKIREYLGESIVQPRPEVPEYPGGDDQHNQRGIKCQKRQLSGQEG